jgi:hypothetical protein
MLHIRAHFKLGFTVIVKLMMANGAGCEPTVIPLN